MGFDSKLDFAPPNLLLVINTRREHSFPRQQKIGLNIYWIWPRPSEQDPISPSVSLSHQEASISVFILLHQRADRMKTTITEN